MGNRLRAGICKDMKYLITVLTMITMMIQSCSTTDTKKAGLVGAYGNYEKVTTEEVALFEEAIKAYDTTLRLKPKKVCKQVVAGLNYQFLCVDADKKEHTVIISKPLPGQGDPRVTSIDNKR